MNYLLATSHLLWWSLCANSVAGQSQQDQKHRNVSIHGRGKGAQAAEMQLFTNLFRVYDKGVRPTRNASKPIVVRLGITMRIIFDLDERNQVFSTMIWLNLLWHDEMLQWDPADYGGLTAIRLPGELLWQPDIVLYNNADDFASGVMRTKAMVYSDGRVFWGPPVRITSSCQVNVQYFPFDTQECLLKFGSWIYNGLQVDVNVISDAVDLTTYVKNGEWELQSVKAERNVMYYPSWPEPFPDVTFRVVIRRKVLFFAYTILSPCVMMSILTLLVFVLPPDSGEKIALGITVLLAFSVFELAIAEVLPETSESVPLIVIYLTSVMTMASMSVIMTVFVINIDWRQPGDYKVSPWIERVILGKLATWVGLDTDYSLLRRKSLARLAQRPLRSQAKEPRNDNDSVQNIGPEFAVASPAFGGEDTDLEVVEGENGHTSCSNEESRRATVIADFHGEEKAAGNPRGVRNEWRQVAQVMDRCLFWIFAVALVSVTVIVLVIMPLVHHSGAAMPIERTL